MSNVTEARVPPVSKIHLWIRRMRRDTAPSLRLDLNGTTNRIKESTHFSPSEEAVLPLPSGSFSFPHLPLGDCEGIPLSRREGEKKEEEEKKKLDAKWLDKNCCCSATTTTTTTVVVTMVQTATKTAGRMSIATQSTRHHHLLHRREILITCNIRHRINSSHCYNNHIQSERFEKRRNR